MVCFGFFGGKSRRNAGNPLVEQAQAAHLARLNDMQHKQDAEHSALYATVALFSELFSLEPESLPGGKNSKASSSSASSSLISLSELDQEQIRQLETLRRRMNQSRNAGGQIALLAPESPLRRFVCDSLLRKHSFGHLVDLFAQAAEDNTLPDFCQDITPKDLVIGLFLGSLPDDLGHFITLLCQANSIVPLCWPVGSGSKQKLTQNVLLSQTKQKQLMEIGGSGGGGPIFGGTCVNWDTFLYLRTAVKSKSSGLQMVQSEAAAPATVSNHRGEKIETSSKASSSSASKAPKLLVWHGTALGKTHLLQQAEMTNASLISQTASHGGLLVSADDLGKAALVHKGSIDLSACSSLLPGQSELWIADVHVHADMTRHYESAASLVSEYKALLSQAPSPSDATNAAGGPAGPTEQQLQEARMMRKQKMQEFRALATQANRGVVQSEDFNAVVSTLVSHGALCLHVDADDFDPESGEILAPLITSLLPKAAVVVWRDFEEQAHAGLVEKVLSRNAKVLKKLASTVVSTTGPSSSSSSKGSPSDKDKEPATLILLENMGSFRSQARANAVVKQFRVELAAALSQRKTWPDLPSHLDLQASFEANQQSYELSLRKEMLDATRKLKLNFGMQKICEKMRAAEEQERHLPWQNNNELDEHIQLALELADRTESLQKNRETYFGRGLDEMTLFFLDKLLLSADMKRLENRSLPVQRALMQKSQVDRIKTFAGKLEFLYSKDDFAGMESFWNEIQTFYQCAVDISNAGGRTTAGVVKEGALWKQLEKARSSYTSLIARRGAPMQLLAGNPLAISSQAFLAQVLRDLDMEELASPSSQRKLRVISVIGAQSSAKSTLMNFLFGSEFAVSAGRCTCGLYASVFFTQKFAILVLDSEGLLGVSDSSRGDIFDGQMTLMCLNCSHVVLINHKGELSRQLQDLIEICLFAMRHLKINKNKPKIGFVLRDQQDRSVEVHRQMLQTMKSHLHESAGKLGISLEDLIRIDDTAVYLLPSAYVTVRKHSCEVQWTPELFSQEILALRAQIFNMFDSEDMENVWDNLESWYAHTCHVWDTLVRFGANLLHYKTIQEIEARKDLYELAKQTTQQIMEQDQDGFRAQCHGTTQMFIKRLQASGSDDSLQTDMIDLEFNRSLTSLRDDYVQRSMVLFNQKANQDPRFHETMKEEARKKLGTPMDWVFENYLYTWKLSLKKKTDEQAMHKMWTHFTNVLNQYLSDSSHQATLSETKARALFASEWDAYEEAFQDRLAKIAKSQETIQYELIIQFNNVVSKLMHEGGPFSLLQEQGPQYLWRKQTLLGERDDEWEKKYFHEGWRNRIQKILKGEIPKGDKTEYNLKNLQMALETPNFLREQIIPKLRAIVKRVLYEQIVFADEIDPFAPLGTPAAEGTSIGDLNASFESGNAIKNDNQQMMDEKMIIDWFRQLMDIVVRVTEKEHLAPFLISLKRPQFIHSLSTLVRIAAYEKRLKEEESQNQKEMDVLLDHKTQIEDHFLLIIKANSNDVEVAKNFAMRYHQNVKVYIQQEILNLCAEIRETVLGDMPDPAKAYERAYQQSFGARNYIEVLEYVLDVNAYVEKLFLIMFARRKAYVVDTKVASLRERVRTIYKLILSICDQWAHTATRGRAIPGGIAVPQLVDGVAVTNSAAGALAALDAVADQRPGLLGADGEKEEKGGSSLRVDEDRDGEHNAAQSDNFQDANSSGMLSPSTNTPFTTGAGGVLVGTGGSSSSSTGSKLTLKDLREFIAQTAMAQQPTAEDLRREAQDPGNAEFLGESRNWKQDNLLKAYKVVVDRIPETAEFPVRDAQIFCSAFRQHLLQLQENLEEKLDARRGNIVNLDDLNLQMADKDANIVCQEAPAEDHDRSSTNSWIDDQLQKGLQEQSKTAWGMIKGCSARCPLCGSKCDQVGEHARHRCTHHLFPAFHGWMDRQNGYPSFHYCKSKEAFEGTYQCNDGEWRPLEVFLRETHEAWLPFCAEEDQGSVKDISLLQSAWTNCKIPLLEYFKPMVDEMPAEWSAFYEPDRALQLADLRKAKDVIRKVRERRFVPEEYYKNLK
ncbi:unnamed protein product [Amoebophrya sp. A25]|nr:unnamed protein product [Amoebophrya sp. A25]|eukprot:GSA25T00007387001.1